MIEIDLPPVAVDRSINSGSAIGTMSRKQRERVAKADEAELLALVPRIVEFIVAQSGIYRVN
jgi:hypothetical protein